MNDRVLTFRYSFIQMFMASLGCLEPVERQSKFVGLLLSLTKYDSFYENTTTNDSDASDDERVKESIPNYILMFHRFVFY